MLAATALLVEDNAGEEVLMLRALKKHTCIRNVAVTRDGAEALDYLFRRGRYSSRSDQMPTIVLLDLHLPKIGGLAVLARIRAEPRTKLLPVVLLTSSDEERDQIAGLMNGTNSFVRKPIAFREFESAVQKIGLYRLTLNQSPMFGRRSAFGDS